MKDVLSNIWVKRCVSIFNVAYFAVIVLLTYATFLYKLEFAEGMQASFFSDLYLRKSCIPYSYALY